MSSLSQFLADHADTLSQVNTPENWWQLTLIAASLLVAWLVISGFGRLLTQRGAGANLRMRPLIPIKLQRIVWPSLALLLILISYAVLQLLDEPVQLLRPAAILLLTFILLRIVQQWLRNHFLESSALKFWIRLMNLVVWLGVISHLSNLLPWIIAQLDSLAITVGETRISVLSVLNLIILIAIFFTIAVWVSSFLERRLKEYDHLSPGIRVGLGKFARYALITFAVLLALDAVGIDLTALTLLGGAIGVGIGFGLQRIASNFISGFLVLFDRSIQPGDLVRIGDRIGQIKEMRARYIVVEDFDGIATLIPNENLITNEVINLSYGSPNVRLKVKVEISYEDDPEKALSILINLARKQPRVLDEPEPAAILLNYGASGIELELSFWISDPINGMANLRSDINIAIWRAFRDNNIHFPYPQHDVHIKELPPDFVLQQKK